MESKRCFCSFFPMLHPTKQVVCVCVTRNMLETHLCYTPATTNIAVAGNMDNLKM